MVETAKTAKAPEMSKRARWEKIKRELLKLPKKVPEIKAIAIDTRNEGILIVTDPISHNLHMDLYDIGRSFRYKFGFPFEKFEIENLAQVIPGYPWQKLILPGYKIIYQR